MRECSMKKRLGVGRGVRHRRGFLITETTLGLVLIGTLLGFLTVAVVQHESGLRRLAANRAAERRVESALTALQTGQTVADETIKFQRLQTASPMPGQIWVEVSTVAGSHKATLTGLAPVAAVSQQEATHATK